MLCQRYAQGELEWSKQLRGHVLSSFFYGYIVTQVFGGWLASRYGGKHVFGAAILLTVVATMLVPVAARAHVSLLVALRVVMGLACVCTAPASLLTPYMCILDNRNKLQLLFCCLDHPALVGLLLCFCTDLFLLHTFLEQNKVK